MNTLRTLLVVLPALVLIGCSTPDLPLPKGTSEGYHSIRLKEKSSVVSTPAKYQLGQSFVRKAIATKLQAHGLKVTTGESELIAAHLVVIQEGDTTTALGEYFGSGLETDAIADLAHRRNVTNRNSPEYFRRAGLVIDILDAKTNELIFRNYVIRDILPEASLDAVRAQLIDEAVQEVLEPFWK